MYCAHDPQLADMRQAIMMFADVSRSNFTGAILKHADMTGAHRQNVKGLTEPTIADG